MTNNLAAIRHLPVYEDDVHGLRVLVMYDAQLLNYSLSIAVPGGMRAEEEGEEGFSHLLEHLVYQDSLSTPSVQREADLSAQGSVLGGNTHMEYTEFYESGLPEYLDKSIQRVLEQVFSPAFTQKQLEEQIQAVDQERSNRLSQAPAGVLPWPHLTGMYWDDFANSHDGSGDLRLRDRVTAEKLRALHQRLFTPENAVLVILSPLQASEVVKSVRKVLEDLQIIPDSECKTYRAARGKAIEKSVDQSILAQPQEIKRRISVTRISDSYTISEGYLGSVVLADLLSIGAQIDVSSGVFGIADVVHDDLLVIVDDSGLALNPLDRLRAAQKATDEMAFTAIERAIYRVEGCIRNDQKMVRAIARDTLLRNNHRHIFELKEALAELADDMRLGKVLITSAAQQLSTQPYASLTIEPTEEER